MQSIVFDSEALDGLRKELNRICESLGVIDEPTREQVARTFLATYSRGHDTHAIFAKVVAEVVPFRKDT